MSSSGYNMERRNVPSMGYRTDAYRARRIDALIQFSAQALKLAGSARERRANVAPGGALRRNRFAGTLSAIALPGASPTAQSAERQRLRRAARIMSNRDLSGSGLTGAISGVLAVCLGDGMRARDSMETFAGRPMSELSTRLPVLYG